MFTEIIVKVVIGNKNNYTVVEVTNRNNADSSFCSAAKLRSMQIRLEIPANILCCLKYHYIVASAVLKLGFLISIFESTAAVTQTRK